MLGYKGAWGYFRGYGLNPLGWPLFSKFRLGGPPLFTYFMDPPLQFQRYLWHRNKPNSDIYSTHTHVRRSFDLTF